MIANAVTLFREKGFDATRVREIAERCDVSEATFFNYFPSKDAVLDEWARAGVETVFLEVAERAGEGSLRRPIREVIRGVAERVGGDDALQRRAWSCVRMAPRAASRGLAPGRQGARLLVQRARERGEVRGDVPVEQLAELLTSVVCSSVSHWLAQAPETPGREPLELRLRRAVDLLLDGFRKRNERVSGPAAGPRPIA